MNLKIAVLADTHFDSSAAGAKIKRRCDIADVLLLRAVHRINRMIRPDVTLFLGDAIDDGVLPHAAESLRRMREIADLLKSPVIVIPGNHDGDVKSFYSVFERPSPVVEIKGVRVLPFVDPEEPGWNARREARDIERFAQARAGFDGPIISVQHTPLFPPGACDCPYNYVNAAEIVDAMRAHGVRLAISGHYHRGMDPAKAERATFLAAPALCESPFAFLTVSIEGDEVRSSRCELRMPERLALFDAHVHTPFAYCSENMDVARAMALAEDFGLAGMAFAEHSGQLYFEKKTYWSGHCLALGVEGARPEDNRMDAYFAAAARADVPEGSIGLEVDCDYRGRPLLRERDRARARFLIGAIHKLSEWEADPPDIARASDEFLWLLRRFLGAGIGVLAHPFRVFRRAGVEPPESLFEPVARMLRHSGVAAELNFHHNEPSPEFLRLCINSGVKLTFGSDAHNLYEVGEFAPHLDFLRAIGFDGDLKEILVDPRLERRNE